MEKGSEAGKEGNKIQDSIKLTRASKKTQLVVWSDGEGCVTPPLR